MGGNERVPQLEMKQIPITLESLCFDLDVILNKHINFAISPH